MGREPRIGGEVRRSSLNWHQIAPQMPVLRYAYISARMDKNKNKRNNFKLMAYLRYVRGLKFHIVLSLITFLLSGVLGYFYAMMHPEDVSILIGIISEAFSPIMEMSTPQIALYIFFHNTLLCLVAVLLGVALGIIPILFAASNGALLGVLAAVVRDKFGWTAFVVGVLPHGVFEIPAMILSIAVGIKFGQETLNAALRRNGKKKLRVEIINGLKFFAGVVMPLLAAAAIIEAFITFPLTFPYTFKY